MKILILTEHTHNRIGGIETYTRLLMDYFHSLGHEIAEFSLDLNFNKVIEGEKPFVKQLYVRDKKYKTCSLQLKKLTKKIEICSKDYDLIINQINNVPWSKNVYSSEKWIFIQHFSYRFYKQEFIMGKFLAPIIYFGMWLFKFKNPINRFKNIVVFSEKDIQELKIKTTKTFVVPLAKYSINEMINFQTNKITKTDKFLFLGRIDNSQKNVKFVQKTIGKNNKIDFYGSGKINLIKLTKNIKYKGFVKPINIPNIIQKYKWFVMLSNYEGFGFTLVETLSCGVLSIVSESFASAQFLTQDFSFLIKNNKKREVERVLTEINAMSAKEYEIRTEKCFKFAIENLSLEKFYDNWRLILDYFSK